MAGCPGILVVKHDCFPNAKGHYNYDHAIKRWFGGHHVNWVPSSLTQEVAIKLVPVVQTSIKGTCI